MIKRSAGITGIAIVIIVLLMTISLAGGAYLWDLYRGQEPSLNQSPEETTERQIGEIRPEATLKPLPPTAPRNLRPIPSGTQTYRLSGKFTGPTIASVTIDPLDAKSSQNQKISVAAVDTNPITSVQSVVKVGDKTSTVNLKVVQGNSTNGTWEGSLTFPDGDVDQLYVIETTAKSATGTSTVPLSWR